MSLIQQLLNKVSALTEKVNTISTSAKKTSEFPQQSILDENSKIRVEKNGISEHIKISQIASSGGLKEWNAGIYNSRVAVYKNDLIYKLTSIATLPYNSVNFDL